MASMIPGMGQMMGQGGDEEASKRMKRMMFIFDSMSNEELDSDGTMFRSSPSPPAAATTKAKTVATSSSSKETLDDDLSPREPNKRVLRVARGSGTSVNEVEEVLAQHLMFSKMVKKAGGKAGWFVRPFPRSSFCGSLERKHRASRMQNARGRPNMPMMGPGGMPDLSSMSPSQLSAMKVIHCPFQAV